MPADLRSRLIVTSGNLVEIDVDAIVNAANASLLGGGGVDGAIHRAAGPELLEACRLVGGCPTGEARITPGFRLKARHIIHTVGPVWSGGSRREPELLASAYERSLDLARKHGLKTLAFPAISTGAYRFPLERAARIALETSARFVVENELPERVTFVCFGDESRSAHEMALSEVLKRTGQ